MMTPMQSATKLQKESINEVQARTIEDALVILSRAGLVRWNRNDSQAFPEASESAKLASLMFVVEDEGKDHSLHGLLARVGEDSQKVVISSRIDQPLHEIIDSLYAIDHSEPASDMVAA